MKRSLTDRMFGWWKRMHLADRILLVFMVVLLCQTAHNLYANELAGQPSTALDAVIRTTSASIFGYFISAGVQGGTEKKTDVPRAPIGFSAGTEEASASLRNASGETESGEMLALPPELRGESIEGAGKQQILVVGGIGLAALLLLIFAGSWGELSSTAMVTLSQLRDFVSGSVGFLIRHSGVGRSGGEA